MRGGEKVEGVKVTLGAHNLSYGAWSDEEIELGVPMSSVVIHPNYKAGNLNKWFAYNSPP